MRGAGWGLALLPCPSWCFFADGVGRQLLSFLGMVVREMGKGGVFDGFHIPQRPAWLGGGEVKKGPFLAAHAAGSLLQKSCFRKTPGAFHLSRETKIGQAWPGPVQPTSLTHPHAESAGHGGPAHLPSPVAGLPLQGKQQGGPCPGIECMQAVWRGGAQGRPESPPHPCTL